MGNAKAIAGIHPKAEGRKAGRDGNGDRSASPEPDAVDPGRPGREGAAQAARSELVPGGGCGPPDHRRKFRFRVGRAPPAQPGRDGRPGELDLFPATLGPLGKISVSSVRRRLQRLGQDQSRAGEGPRSFRDRPGPARRPVDLRRVGSHPANDRGGHRLEPARRPEPRDTLCQEAILSQGAQVYRGRATHFGSGAAFAFVGGGPVLCRVSGLQPA